MKCLLCTRQFEEKNLSVKHYITDHKINTANWFFKVLFKEKKGHFFSRKCYRCEAFLTSESEEKRHNFLFHLQKGGKISLEYRPIIVKIDGTIKKFVIEYNKHKNSYDFEHLVKLVEDFFAVVDIKFVTDGKKESIIKSSFETIWSSRTYFGRFFNEYIRVSLTNDIKKEL